MHRHQTPTDFKKLLHSMFNENVRTHMYMLYVIDHT